MSKIFFLMSFALSCHCLAADVAAPVSEEQIIKETQEFKLNIAKERGEADEQYATALSQFDFMKPESYAGMKEATSDYLKKIIQIKDKTIQELESVKSNIRIIAKQENTSPDLALSEIDQSIKLLKETIDVQQESLLTLTEMINFAEEKQGTFQKDKGGTIRFDKIKDANQFNDYSKKLQELAKKENDLKNELSKFEYK